MYNGLLKSLKSDYVNLGALFNLRDKNSKAQVSNFTVRSKPRINKGATAIGETDYKLPVNINTVTFKNLTATEPLSVNEIFVDHHRKDLTDAEKAEALDMTAQRYAVTEATYGYYMQTPELLDVTADILAIPDATRSDELFSGVKQMVGNGWNAKDLIVVISEIFALDLANEDYQVPDYSVKTTDMISPLSKKLGVAGVVVAPADALSGNYLDAVLTPATTADWRIYVKEYACFKTWDESMVEFRNIVTLEYPGSVPQLIGAELMGFGQFNDETTPIISSPGVIKYQATGAVPADPGTHIEEDFERITPKTAGTPITLSVQETTQEMTAAQKKAFEKKLKEDMVESRMQNNPKADM